MAECLFGVSDAENNGMGRTIYDATSGAIALVHGTWCDSIVNREEIHALLVLSAYDANIKWRDGKDGRHDYNASRGHSARLLLRECIAGAYQ